MSECPDLERRLSVVEVEAKELKDSLAVITTRVSVLEHDITAVESLTTRLNAISDAQQSLEVELNTLVALSKQHAETLNHRVKELSNAMASLRDSHVERTLSMERTQKSANLSLALGILAFAGVVLGVVFQYIASHQ